MRIFKILSEQKKFLENKGYKVLYIGLYGSQNYGLEHEKSDIDVRAVISLSLEDIITNKKVSKKYETEYGDIDVKDLYTYYEVIRKGNFSFIEPFQTKFFIGDKKLREMFGSIKLNWKSVKGAMLEKAKAFRHEYPSKKTEFDKWGYDPKQLHHIIRLLRLLQEFDDTRSFIDYSEKKHLRNYLMALKLNTNNMCDKYDWVDDFETMKQYILKLTKHLNDYKYEPVDLEKEISNYIENIIKIELGNTKVHSARQYRTFGTSIPKKDIDKFPILKDYEGHDISYIIYESLEIL